MPFLDRASARNLAMELAVLQPLSPLFLPVFLDILKALDKPLDVEAYQAIFNDQRAGSNIPPEAVLALPAHLRQAVWAAAPYRFDSDLGFLLEQYDCDVASALKPYNLLAKDKKRKRGAPLHAEIYACLKGGDSSLYLRACNLLYERFQRSRDPKWASMRCELYLLLARESCSTGDPLGPLILEMEKLLMGKAGTTADGILKTVRQLCQKSASSTGPAVPVAGTITQTAIKIKEIASATYTFAQGRPHGAAFLRPVSEQFPPAFVQTYMAKIAPRSAMDLGSIQRKARTGGYKSLDALLLDLRKVADNSRAFNGQDAVYTPEAEGIVRFGEAKIQEARLALAAVASAKTGAALTVEIGRAHV